MRTKKSKIKLVLFDADNTLWKTERGEYVSKLDSPFFCLSSRVIIREKDGQKFVLRKDTRKALELLKNQGVLCGLVSDNHLKDVKRVCKLFKIWQFFDPLSIEVQLFKGYCPKHLMVKKILVRLTSKNLDFKKNEIVWIDDKDYSQEARAIGVKFFHFRTEDSLLKVIKKCIIV